jgi:hypothetical protein
MKKRIKSKIFKGAIVLLFAAVMISSTFSVMATHEKAQKESKNYQTTTLSSFVEGFESYEDFTLDFSPWTQLDRDGGGTWGMEGHEWPNMYYTGSFMILNPYQTIPLLGDNYTHSGNKMATCWDTVTDSAPNDDWLFSPQLPLDTGAGLTFWGRSINDNYGLEEIEVGISTTDTDPSSFTIISGDDFIAVPPEWTEFSYDLSDYAGNNVYIAIHVVSWDIFAFFLDDFEVTGVYLPEPDLECEGSLSITRATPNEEIAIGSFTVKNIGEADSQLSWAIEDIPDWGVNWTFTPAGGSILKPTDPTVTVQVSIVAPEEKNQEFSGEIKIVNAADPNDFEIIQVTLSTPKNSVLLFQRFLENHQHISQVLQQLFGLF